MAITTLAGLHNGLGKPSLIFKGGATPEAAGLLHSHWYATNYPPPGAAPSPGVNGAAITAPLTGMIDRVNPASGNAYLGRLALQAGVLPGTYFLCDRLWHNSGLSVTLTSAQTITPAAIPARDRSGTTAGVDVLAGLEWSVAGGAGVPTATISYTNQAGTAGQTAVFTSVATPNAGTMERWPLAAGDTGVRSIQSFQWSATHTSGTIHIILYRIIATLIVQHIGGDYVLDGITAGMPRIYNDSVLFLMQIPNSTGSNNIAGTYTEAHG